LQRFSRPLAKKPNMSWTPTSQNASILHLDASFENPCDMPEEPYPLLAGENIQPIDLLYRSGLVIAIGCAPCIICYRPTYVNSKVLY
jgi:hypothetical protein